MLAEKGAGLKAKVRPADLQRDRELLISLLFQHLTRSSDRARFEWLYQRNPHGPARAWLATDAGTGEIIGTSASFRRRVVVNGVEQTGWVLGDFCISGKYRSLGPALQLQRATLAAVGDSGQAEFCYDFPSRQLAAIYQRLGIVPVARMIRLVKLLHLGEKLQRVGWSKALARPAGWLGNLVLQASNPARVNKRGWDIAIHEGKCSEEFSALLQNTPAQNTLEVQRSAEYLNWRYLQHPSVCHQILTARKGRDLHGYLVFSHSNGNAQIEDWWPRLDHELFTALIADLVQRLRRARTMALSAFLLDTDPRLHLLKRMGFWLRESSPLMVHWAGAETVPRPELRLMHGDRDI